MSSVSPLGCCPCENGRYIAYPCWEMRQRVFNNNGSPTSNNATPQTLVTSSGGSPNSFIPPIETEVFLVLIGAGGAGNGGYSGGGGAYIETNFNISQTSTIRVGVGGPITNIANTMFGGGRIGPATAPTNQYRYGGGSTSYRTALSSSTQTSDVFIAGGGGGASSLNFFSLTNLHGRGGDAGISSSISPSSNISAGGNANNTTAGSGGVVGGGSGSLGTLPNNGAGGVGVAIDATTGQGGGGGGGGGFGGGGGGGNQTITTPTTTTYGGAGSGGASFVGNSDLNRSHAARNGYTQASPFTQITNTRGIGDGGLGVGGDGRAVIQWRACDDCPCEETPVGLPPALHICLTVDQFNSIKDLASYSNGQCGTMIGFDYKGWPYYLDLNNTEVGIDRPCDRLVNTADISGGRYVSDSGYCCKIWAANKILIGGECLNGCPEVCPPTIYFCEQYLTQTLGVSMCDINDNSCITITYLGCDYKLLFNPSDGDCLVEPPTPLNVGTLKSIGAWPCTETTQTTWTVGPNTDTGGFRCNSTFTLTFPYNGLTFDNPRNAACPDNTMIDYVASYKMCKEWLDGISPCGSEVGDVSPQCWNCTEEPSNNGIDCLASINGNYIIKEGLCTPTPGQPQFTSCIRPLHQAAIETVMMAEQVFDGTVIQGECSDPFGVALTITRTCPSTTPFAWLSCSPGNASTDEATITIDGCTFTGNGTPAQFASVINSVLGSRGITATGSSNYWWGARWRGTAAYPFDVTCSTSPTGPDYAGDSSGNPTNAEYTGDGTTTAILYGRRYMAKLRTEIEVRPGEFQSVIIDPITGEIISIIGCFCTTGEECPVKAFYSTAHCVPVGTTPITPSDFGPLTLDEVFTSPQPPATTCLSDEFGNRLAWGDGIGLQVTVT